MYEHVSTAACGLNEAIAFLRVEPLHRAGRQQVAVGCFRSRPLCALELRSTGLLPERCPRRNRGERQNLKLLKLNDLPAEKSARAPVCQTDGGDG